MSDKNKLPDVFNTEQLVKLFDVIERPKLGIACALAFFCGLRISEVCNLKIEHIDFERKRIKIVDSKNSRRSFSGYGKDRYIPIPEQMLSSLKMWVDIMNGGTWFLPSHNSPDKHLRPKTINEQFRDALKKAGLLIPLYTLKIKQRCNGKLMEKEVTRHKYHFHTLRHAYATYLCDKGVDIYTISDLLGHNQVTTTQIYARISDKQRNKAISEAFNTSLRSRIVKVEAPPHTPSMQEKLLEIKKLELEIKKIEIESGKEIVKTTST